MIKNTNYIALFFWILFPIDSYTAMRQMGTQIRKGLAGQFPTQTKQPLQPIGKPISLKPGSKPTTESLSEKSATYKPGALEYLGPEQQQQQLFESEEQPPSEIMPLGVATISPKDWLPTYNEIINDAQKYNENAQKRDMLDLQSYLKYIEQIEKEDISKETLADIDQKFTILKNAIKAKTVLNQLNDLIQYAKTTDIPNQILIEYINFLVSNRRETNISQLDPADIIQKNITELTESIQKFLYNQFNELIEKAKGIIKAELIPQYEQLAQRIHAEDISLEELNYINKNIKALKNRIKQEEAKQIETQKVQAEAEAAQKKVEEEKARLKEEELKKEMDDSYKETEKEYATWERVQIKLAEARQQKELKLEQEKFAKNKIEQEEFAQAISNLQTKIEALEREQEKSKEQLESTKKQLTEQTTALEQETQKEKEAFEARQKIEREQRLKNLENAKAETLQANNELQQADQDVKELQNRLAELQTAAEIAAQESMLFETTKALERIRQEKNDALQNFIEQKNQIELKAQADLDKIEQNKTEQLQKAKEKLQNKKDFISKTAVEQDEESKALENKFNEETTINKLQAEKEKDDALTRINTRYEQKLNTINEELEQFIKKQAEERAVREKARQETQQEIQQLETELIADQQALQDIENKIKGIQQEKETFKTESAEKYEQEMQVLEKEEKEVKDNIKQIQEKIKETEIKEKIEGHGGSEIPQEIETKETIIPTTTKKEEKVPLQPSMPIILPEQEQIITPQEEKEKIAEVVPEITPEVTPVARPQEKVPTTTPERVYPQAMEQKEVSTITEPEISSSSSTGISQASPVPTPQTTPAAFEPSISSGGTPTATSVENISPTGITTRYQQKPREYIAAPKKTEAPSQEVKEKEKAQPKWIVLLEKWLPNWKELLPAWILQRLEEKPTIEVKQKTEEPQPVTPITSFDKLRTSGEEKPAKKEAGIIEKIIENVKKPVTNAINYLRSLFAGS